MAKIIKMSSKEVTAVFTMSEWQTLIHGLKVALFNIGDEGGLGAILNSIIPAPAVSRSPFNRTYADDDKPDISKPNCPGCGVDLDRSKNVHGTNCRQWWWRFNPTTGGIKS